MSGEERMAILKEVEAHLGLLKEFVGVIPDDELAERKRALYAMLDKKQQSSDFPPPIETTTPTSGSTDERTDEPSPSPTKIPAEPLSNNSCTGRCCIGEDCCARRVVTDAVKCADCGSTTKACPFYRTIEHDRCSFCRLGSDGPMVVGEMEALAVMDISESEFIPDEFCGSRRARSKLCS
jgi:hypothetical protein